jgi:hypothetical protein
MTKKFHDLADVTVEIIQQTDRGVLVSTGKPKEAQWMPLAQIELVSDGNGRTYTMTCPQWLAEEKGLV